MKKIINDSLCHGNKKGHTYKNWVKKDSYSWRLHSFNHQFTNGFILTRTNLCVLNLFHIKTKSCSKFD